MGGNWAGYDSFSRASDPPGGGVVQLPTNCSPSPLTNKLAPYTALHYTQSADKYFCRYFHTTSGAGLFVPSSEIPALRGIGFYFLVPIDAPSGAREQRGDQTGKDWGVADARATCSAIVSALNSNQGLVLPDNRIVHVYLDVEGDVALTDWYWEGWAEGVWEYYDDRYGAPFYPNAYANPDFGPAATRAARQQTMNVLNTYAALPETHHQRCWGLWTQAPNPNVQSDCNNAPPPPYNNAMSYGVLYWHHWQYALNGACRDHIPVYDPPPSGSGNCRPWVDNDQSNPLFEMPLYMLRIT